MHIGEGKALAAHELASHQLAVAMLVLPMLAFALGDFGRRVGRSL